MGTSEQCISLSCTVTLALNSRMRKFRPWIKVMYNSPTMQRIKYSVMGENRGGGETHKTS